MPLGCSSGSYSITDRDGGLVTASGVLTSLEWTRVLNDASTAQVTIGVSGPSCCTELGRIRVIRHYLNLYRGEDLVWSGPVTNVDWKAEEVSVEAVDLIGVLDLRVPHQDFTFMNTDLTEIARQLVEDAFAPDDPGHTTVVQGPANVSGGRVYSKDTGLTGDHLRDLADTGIDFTAVGRTLVILPDSFCDVTGRLADEDLPEGLTVSEDASFLATRQVVAGSDSSGVIGSAGGTDAYYGLIERYTEQTSITDSASAQAAAQARLRASRAALVISTQDITLAPTANVALSDLVPGWCLDITSDHTCRTITQRLKMTGVRVSEDGGDAQTPGQEKILVTVSAPSSVV